MPSIQLSEITFSYTSRPLLDRVSLEVGNGERACLIGPNGCGKSTLLKISAGDIIPESGRIDMRGPQSETATRALATCAPDETVAHYLDAALAHILALSTRFDAVTVALAERGEDTQLNREYDDLLAQMIAADVWSLDSRINETLAGLGLPQLAGDGRARKISTLSPGQLARLELAATLIAQPPTLILDEPTNHLDDEAATFLSHMLQDRTGPLLMASHDRAFIDEVATVIYDLDTPAWQAIATADGAGNLPGVYQCTGNYSDYLIAKSHARASHQSLHSEQQAEKRELQAHRQSSRTIAQGGIHLKNAKGIEKKFYSDRAASTAVRRTRNDDRRLELLGEHEVRKPRSYLFQLGLGDVQEKQGIAISVRDAALPGRLSAVTFDLAYGEHLLITGPNGAGKSTLVNWIVSGQPPTGTQSMARGHINRDSQLAAVPQRLPQLHDAGFTEQVWNSGIGEFGTGAIHPSLWATPIVELSAGNQRRVQLAVAASHHPDILVIDEPTNYLDLDTTEALEQTLFQWSGTLVVTTHDRWLVEHWKGKRLRLDPAE